MATRSDVDRLDAIEGLITQSFAERFSRQLNPAHSLATFADNVFDISGRGAAVQFLIEQIARRMQFLATHRRIR